MVYVRTKKQEPKKIHIWRLSLKKNYVQVKQDFSITVGGSVALFLVFEDLLSAALTPDRQLTFPL